jgi:transcriptional regulator with XRE-family HTH domain
MNPRPQSVAARSDRTFGRMLKEWRGRRGYSQLGLALAARTTQRHLSFIESGRARSRDILRLRPRQSLAGIYGDRRRHPATAALGNKFETFPRSKD